MKAIAKVRPEPGVEIIDVPEPDVELGAVLVEAVAVGVCGTDAEIANGAYGWAPPGEERLILGHESLGRVVDPGPTGLSVGEITGRAAHGRQTMPDTGGHVLMIGPTALLLYKAYGIEGGVLFPLYQRTNGTQPGERFRFGVNVSYFFWLK